MTQEEPIPGRHLPLTDLQQVFGLPVHGRPRGSLDPTKEGPHNLDAPRHGSGALARRPAGVFETLRHLLTGREELLDHRAIIWPAALAQELPAATASHLTGTSTEQLGGQTTREPNGSPSVDHGHVRVAPGRVHPREGRGVVDGEHRDALGEDSAIDRADTADGLFKGAQAVALPLGTICAGASRARSKEVPDFVGVRLDLAFQGQANRGISQQLTEEPPERLVGLEGGAPHPLVRVHPGEQRGDSPRMVEEPLQPIQPTHGFADAPGRGDGGLKGTRFVQ